MELCNYGGHDFERNIMITTLLAVSLHYTLHQKNHVINITLAYYKKRFRQLSFKNK